MQIWILMSGEAHEGGDFLGAFTSKEAADGAIHVEGGCDWVTLFPTTLNGAGGTGGDVLNLTERPALP